MALEVVYTTSASVIPPVGGHKRGLGGPAFAKARGSGYERRHVAIADEVEKPACSDGQEMSKLKTASPARLVPSPSKLPKRWSRLILAAEASDDIV